MDKPCTCIKYGALRFCHGTCPFAREPRLGGFFRGPGFSCCFLLSHKKGTLKKRHTHLGRRWPQASVSLRQRRRAGRSSRMPQPKTWSLMFETQNRWTKHAPLERARRKPFQVHLRQTPTCQLWVCFSEPPQAVQKPADFILWLPLTSLEDSPNQTQTSQLLKNARRIS